MRTGIVRALALGSLSLLASNALAEDDFTGVWEAYSTVRGNSSPITDEGRRMIDEFRSQYGDNFVEPGSYCVPPGLVQTMTSTVSYPVEVIHSPNRLTMLAEYDMQVRRIYLDGRDIPDNYPTTRMGYSVGHWEGDEMVIETGLLSDWFLGAWPRTENTRVIERIHKTTLDAAEEAGAQFTGFVQPAGHSDEVLVFDYTVTDPVLWNEPQEITVYYQRIPDDSSLEYDCPADLWRRGLSGEIQWKPASP